MDKAMPVLALVAALLPSLAVRMGLDDVGLDEKSFRPTILLATNYDASTGRTYGLAKSVVLGNMGDLWILERDGPRWANPLFIGISVDGVERWDKGELSYDKSAKAFGKTADQLVGGDWIKVLRAHRRELAQDSDRDGLTDRMERRLGTDPRKADTDGDAVPDTADPMPDAAPRFLSDAERVLAATYQSACREQGLIGGPVVLDMPKGIRPFEIEGWPNTAVWLATKTGRQGTLGRQYGLGVVVISLSWGHDRGPIGDEPVQWSADRSEAKLKVSVYVGRLAGATYNATVRRVEGDWKVIAFDMASIS